MRLSPGKIVLLCSSDDIDYDTPRTDKKSDERAFSVSDLSHWNSVPESVRPATDPRPLMQNLKTYYFNLCFN